MDWVKGFYLVANDYVGLFNNVLSFYLVIGMTHKPSPEQLILPCRINFSSLKS